MKLTYEQAKDLGLKDLWPSSLDGVVPEVKKSDSGLNKQEEEFQGILKSLPFVDVEAQSIKFRLAGRTWFTPDFVARSKESGDLWVFEVKGFMRDDAAVKIKVAASKYPWIRWVLTTKSKLGWVCRIVDSQSGISRRSWSIETLRNKNLLTPTKGWLQ